MSTGETTGTLLRVVLIVVALLVLAPVVLVLLLLPMTGMMGWW